MFFPKRFSVRLTILSLATCAFVMAMGCENSRGPGQAKQDNGAAEKKANTDDQKKAVAPAPAPAPAEAKGDAKEPSYEGKPLSAWIVQLGDEDKETRYKAATALGKFELRNVEGSHEKVLGALGKAIRDKDRTMRFVADESLRGYGQHALPVFLDALKDKDADVRISAARALGDISNWQFEGGLRSFRREAEKDRAAFPVRTEPVVPALSEALLKDKDSEVRTIASFSLAQFGKEAVPVLITASKTGDAVARKLAVNALGRMTPEYSRKAIPALIELLKEEDADLRYAVVRTIGVMRNEAGEALPALLTASKSQDQAGKAAREVLKEIHKIPRPLAPALLPFLKDPEPYIRVKAIQVLCDLEEGDKECLASLLELIKRRHSQIRGDAARLLVRYGSAAKDAVPALIEVARNDSDPNTLTAAFSALGAIGPEAKAAIPLLKALEKDFQKQLADVQESLQKNAPAKNTTASAKYAQAISQITWPYQAKLAAVQAALKKIDQ